MAGLNMDPLISGPDHPRWTDPQFVALAQHKQESDMVVPRAGDTVRHGPTGEKWVVAYVDGDRIAWVGWPVGEASLADCTLVERVSDETHHMWLLRLAHMQDQSDQRAIKARTILASRKEN